MTRKSSEDPSALRGVLVTASQASPKQIRNFISDRYTSVVLYLDERTSSKQSQAAAKRIRGAGLGLYYWIEIGRNSMLADAHPEWMASLQTHTEWRRHFPNFPRLGTNQVAKTYPWVPVLYAETFDVHLQRVAGLLQKLPNATGIFLNDLQGAPSACGCGNQFCRWTTDYGPLRTATRLPNDAAAQFVVSVGKIMPEAKIIPVWTTECAEHDGSKGAACDGVGCFNGKCWKEYNAQLGPLSAACDQIGVLLPFRDFEPNLSRTGPSGEWQNYALNSFTEILPKRDGRVIAKNRLIAVLQGWDVSRTEQETQIRHAQDSGTAGYIMALAKIEQSWKPRLMEVTTGAKGPSSESPHPSH